MKCKNLKKIDITSKLDPYVQMFLMPGTHMELKTKIVKDNQNPVYNDEFIFSDVSIQNINKKSLITGSFKLSPNDVRKKTIVFQIIDNNAIGKYEGIGEIQIPLWEVDLDVETDMDLRPVTRGKDNKPVLTAR